MKMAPSKEEAIVYSCVLTANPAAALQEECSAEASEEGLRHIAMFMESRWAASTQGVQETTVWEFFRTAEYVICRQPRR